MWLLCIGTALALTVAEVPNPRSTGDWVSDDAEVMDEATEQRLDTRIDALHGDLGVEIAVVTVQDVPGTPKDFATELFEHWGIGSAQADNGLLVLLVLGERRIEMETGYGLEPVLPDGWLGTMQVGSMVPHFKNGAYGAGLEAGVVAVDERLRGDPDQAGEGTRGAIPNPVPAAASAGPVPWWIPAGIAGGVGLALWALFIAWSRKRERTCPECKVDMPCLSEAEDDAHLDPGQQTEEAVGSIDYKVYVCSSCDFTRVAPRKKWFSGHRRCGQCGNRTLRSSSTTEVSATYDHGGRVRVTQRCAHCSYHHSYTRSTPRKTRSSSSSSSSSSSFGGGSSGGGSFGGGSSGGGGAGSSW
jgi:uncharacterized protein